MRVVIVGSGPSASGFLPPDNVTVISVNGSIEWLSRADYWFTLDPSPVNMQRMTVRKSGVVYYAAVQDNVKLPWGVNKLNVVAHRGREPKIKDSPEWWMWRWSAIPTLNTTPWCINTGNSVWGALGLAYHMKAEKVALVGVDASTEERVEGGRTNNLSHLPMLFESATGQIDFINCGEMKSRVQKMTIKEGMEWLTDGI